MVPQTVFEPLRAYHNEWRHHLLPEPSVSGLYALYPQKPCAVRAEFEWPVDWPQGSGPGVYLVFGFELDLLYVGKTDWLGKRLSDHFKNAIPYDRNSGCREAETWGVPPAFLCTIAVSKR
jgi:hypothetical protein